MSNELSPADIHQMINDGSIYLESSYEYDTFTLLPENRKKRRNRDSLRESLSSEFTVTAGIVNENYEIIDGQNRFLECKTLELPFIYIVVPSYSYRQIQVINRNVEQWDPYDILHHCCVLESRGDHEGDSYSFFKKMLHMYSDNNGVDINMTQMIAFGRTTESKIDKETFRRGEMLIEKESRIDFERKIGEASELKRAMHHLGLTKIGSLRSATIFVVSHKLYDHKRMLEKIKTKLAKRRLNPEYATNKKRTIDALQYAFNIRVGPEQYVTFMTGIQATQ